MNIAHTKKTITLEAAQLLANEAIQHAKTLPLNISVSVFDAGGNLKAFQSMDQAPLISTETSMKKARFALGFGMPTGNSWHQFIKDDPILQGGAPQLPDFILLGGGVPIYAGNELIGSIGVSGGHYQQDEACIQFALQALRKLDSTIR